MRYDHNRSLLESSIPGMPEPRRGKVRDIYDLGDYLLLVATDRISAFDCVMPNGIPDKGKVLTQMSLFWLDFIKEVDNHLVTADVNQYPVSVQAAAADLDGRSMLVRKTTVIPVECVARGYLVGSGWKEYQQNQTVCGIPLKPGYRQADQLEEPIFTPAFKAEQGEHDENISFEKMVELTDRETAETLRTLTLNIYRTGAERAAKAGIIIADTKLEFGRDDDGKLILIDEILTPDSSRFWPAEQYSPGANPPSLDKQFVRDYLTDIKFNQQPPAPILPDDVVEKTRDKYLQALQLLAGKTL